MSFITCGQDINIQHPACNGAFIGVCDRRKVTINPSSPVAVVFSDDGNTGVGQVVVKDIYQGNNYSNIVNISKLIRIGTTLGLISGGNTYTFYRTFNKCSRR